MLIHPASHHLCHLIQPLIAFRDKTLEGRHFLLLLFFKRCTLTWSTFQQNSFPRARMTHWTQLVRKRVYDPLRNCEASATRRRAHVRQGDPRSVVALMLAIVKKARAQRTLMEKTQQQTIKENNLTHFLLDVTSRLLSNCSDTHVVQRSSSVGWQRPTHKITGDTDDPNSLLQKRAGQGMQMWLPSNCSVTLTLRDKGCRCGSFPSAVTRSTCNGAPVSACNG